MVHSNGGRGVNPGNWCWTESLDEYVERQKREFEISAKMLTITAFVLDFCRQLGLPCMKGIDILALPEAGMHSVRNVKIKLIDLMGFDHILKFVIYKDSEGWKISRGHEISLHFSTQTPATKLPQHCQHVNRFILGNDNTVQKQ